MLSYRVTLDVPVRLVLFVSGLLDGHHREIGTRRGTGADLLQAGALLLAWFGISQATAYRDLNEATGVLAAKAPSQRRRRRRRRTWRCRS
jgi:hypothetical protein